MLLVKNIRTFAPDDLGVKDLLIARNKIEYVGESISVSLPSCIEVIDGTGLIAIPGLIDGHVHVTGGGGEGGVTTRVPEVKISDLIRNGVTTVLGLLGTDGTTRTIEDLLAKTKAINELGLTAFALTGSYEYPSVTLTGNVRRDMAFISEIIGSKIAISDHRSSCITTGELARLASDVYVGGKIAGKRGVLTIHMGDGKAGLQQILDVISENDLPVSVFHPTHVNRNETLLSSALDFHQMGGMIDLTCGNAGTVRAADVITELRSSGRDRRNITISSDGNGSYSEYDENGNLLKIGVSSLDAVFNELKFMFESKNLPLDDALAYCTVNAATALGLDNRKGRIAPGYDADIVLLNESFQIDTVITSGEIIMREMMIMKNIPFE